MAATEPDSITEYSEDTTHAFDGLGQLYLQFQNKVILSGILQSYLNRIQEIEKALWTVLIMTALGTPEDETTNPQNAGPYHNPDFTAWTLAFGDALDQIGRILNFPRGSLADFDYRTVLRAVILARQSSGAPDQVIGVMKLMLGAIPFDYAEGSASIMITPHGVLPFTPGAIFQILQMTKGGGVRIQMETPPVPDGQLFAFAASGLYLVSGDTAQGLSDTTQDTGGHLNGVLGDPWTQGPTFTPAEVSEAGL